MITKESFQIIDSIYSQMVADIIVIIFYHVTFENVDVDYLLGKVSVDDGCLYSYSGTVAQILALGGFKPEVMVYSGENDDQAILKLGYGGLGIPWDPRKDFMPLKIRINLHPKKCGPDATLESVQTLELADITKSVALSVIYSIFDP